MCTSSWKLNFDDFPFSGTSVAHLEPELERFKERSIFAIFCYWTNGPIEQWTNGPIDLWSNGPMDRWTNRLMVQCTNGPLDQWSNELLDQWWNGPMDHWTNRQESLATP